MSNESKNIERILKGVAIGLGCLLLVLSVFLAVRLGDRQESMEKHDMTDSYTIPADQETESMKEENPNATLPATEAVEEKHPVATEPIEGTEPDIVDDGKKSRTDPVDVTRPTAPVPTKPQPVEPPPTVPAPTEPAPTEPAPTEPAPTEPEKDIFQVMGQVSAQNNTVTQDASFGQGGISAQVPSGTLLDNGTTELVLTIEKKESIDADIPTEAGQSLQPLDVHIEGISKENIAPITICLGKILPNGMNIGNVGLYHVENGSANPMAQVLTAAELDTHNEFYYDPATGDITVAMASFSEVAVVSEPSKWEGSVDHTWYDADATELTIANADQLWSFSQIVGGMASYKNENGETVPIDQDSFAGKAITLTADVDLADKESENDPNLIFYPIGYYNSDGTYEKTNIAITSGLRNFEGTFDGQGHTIANFYQNTWEMKGDHDWYSPEEQYYRDGMGLFGRVYGGTVKNLTVKNFSSDGEITTTGTIAAYAEGATFENIAIFNCNPRVYNIGNGGIVGCVGWYAKEAGLKTTFKNITVDNSNKISALWGSYDVACGGLVGQYYPTSGQSSAGTPKNGGIEMTNCHVAAQMDVYNDVCANYQYYAYRYAGILIGSVRENETVNGHVYPKMDGITAENCTVHFGDWNDYYYCELVANSLASYTHDHQFSRLEQVASVDVENMKVTSLKGETAAIPTSGRVNYVVVNGDHATENATCYHFVDGKVHNHNDYNGDGVDDYETVNGESILVENNHHIYLEFNNLVTGYGWGVTTKAVGDMPGVTILDREEGSSVKKFESLVADNSSYTAGTTVNIGDLFISIENVADPIDTANVQVFVSPVGETSTAGGAYVANTTDWTQGTLTFTGEGAATITITDYNFCTPTVITVEVEALAAPVEPTDSRWIYQDTFDSQGKWKSMVTPSGAETENMLSVADGKLQIIDSANNRVSAVRDLDEALTGEVVVEFEVSSTALTTDAGLYFTLWGKNTSGSLVQATDVRLYSGGIDCYTTKSNKVSGTYTADTTYKVQMVVNVTENTYSVFINDNLIHKNVAMRNPVNSITRIRLWTIGDALVATVTYDNLKIYHLNPICDHTNTELRAAADATCGVAGYTGDTYCADCGMKLSAGETVAATGEHTYTYGICSVCGTANPNCTEPVAPTKETDSRWIYKSVLTDGGTWTTMNTDDTEANCVNHADGKLQITDDADTVVSAYRGLRALTGEVVVEFEVSSTALSETSGLYFALCNNNTTAVDVRLFSNGVDCYTTKNNKVAGTYAADTTYKVQIVADVDSQTYDVFIDGKLTHENVEMRNTVTSLNRVRFYTTSSALAATVTYENLKIYHLNCPHTNTELRNDKAATCGAAGYTGDIYCVDCDERLTEGETIEATGNHSFVTGACAVCGEKDPDYPVAPTDNNDGRWIYKNVLTDGGTWTYSKTDGEANIASLSDGKLQITDDDKTIVTAKRGLRELQGDVVVEFEVSSTAMSNDDGLYFALFNGSIGADIRMFANGIQCYYFDENGKLANSKVAGTYTADTTYKVQIVVNTEDGIFDVFVDGVLIHENLQMRNGVKTITEIRFYTVTGSLAATVTYENLKIYYLNAPTAE